MFFADDGEQEDAESDTLKQQNVKSDTLHS